MFRVQHDPLDRKALISAVSNDAAGAVLLFEGVTRNNFDGRPVLRLEYEAYEEMAEAELRVIGAEMRAKWPDVRVAIAHRLGLVAIGEASVIVAVSAAHRDNAYLASRYGIDQLKLRAPIWKKEFYEDGSEWKANQL